MASPVLAETMASISELKRNPMGTVSAGDGGAVAILNHNEPAFYCVPAKTYEALMNSLILSGGVTVTGTIVGTFFAWLVTRTDLPFKKTMKLLFLVPFMLPAFIGALAWKMLLSPRAGYINRLFMDVLGFDGPIFDMVAFYERQAQIDMELTHKPSPDKFVPFYHG